MRVLHLTHADLDGAVCAVATRTLMDADELVVEKIDYDEIDARVRAFIKEPSHDMLLITDICPKEEVFNELGVAVNAGTFQAKILDHHKSRKWIDNYGFEWAAFNPDVCGARMTYEWLTHECEAGPVPLQSMVEAADVYDRWLLEHARRPEAEKLNRIFHFMGFSRFVRTAVEKLDFYYDPMFDYIDQCLLDSQNRGIEATIKDQFGDAWVLDKGQDGAYITVVGSKHTSELAHTILNRMPHAHFVAVVNPQYNKVELRAREDGTDVSEIALRLGGGGHPEAAGFPFPFQDFLRMLLRTALR